MVKMSYDTLRLAIILGVVLPGVGHIYLGKIKRGIKVVFLVIISGTITGILFSYLSSVVGGFIGSNSIMSILGPGVSFIPLLIWIWQIRDLRRIIRKSTGQSVDELEPPYLQVESPVANDGIICLGCGKRVNKESVICDNCGLKL